MNVAIPSRETFKRVQNRSEIALTKAHQIENLVFSNSGQSYKAPTIVIYDSRVVPDLKLPHITTLES